MDLVEALRSFEAVAAERSFTRGAARAGQPQPVASRRVAALEEHLGARLLVRTSRRVDLSPEGARLLPVARELLAQADRVEHLFAGDAPRTVVAVPAALDHRARAAVRRGLPHLAVVFADDHAAARAAALAEGRADLALLPAADDRAEVRVPLGVAAADDPPARFVVEVLRAAAHERRGRPRALHVLAEDDVPPVRDPLRLACFAAGLRHDQVRVGTPDAEAWTSVFEHGDVVLASAAEAARQGVGWAPLVGPVDARGYRLEAPASTAGPLAGPERAGLLARLAAGLGGTVAGAAGAAGGGAS
ncbi:LysR family transcriptional regulator [Nocardioides zeae]|uniref:LysR family transcriptional regulator n=1 Tax=Nocardioides imazamoxiresistens TaxID=3231893 RepID=A0ABU3PZR1_9ACTN|nr:LysR family transcriptional regulator [Nocardioides zeae]MDT9594715.1 LysR family transcriptional regulator [Nocardioides zeae]